MLFDNAVKADVSTIMNLYENYKKVNLPSEKYLKRLI